MTKFKIGQIVTVTSPKFNRLIVGTTGTVVEIVETDEYPIYVRFEAITAVARMGRGEIK